MKIAELEAHHDAYVASEDAIETMVSNHEFPGVFDVCVRSFPHIVPAIQFRKKREITPQTPPLLAFATICTYAPPLFEHAAIEAMSQFVRSARVLAQHANDYLSALEAANRREELARRLWGHLERNRLALDRPAYSQLEVAQEDVAEVIDLWEELGVIARDSDDTTSGVNFRTQMDVEVEGLCHKCGTYSSGQKESFLKPLPCAKCGTLDYHHICYGHLQ
jgi:hypothetical protein